MVLVVEVVVVVVVIVVPQILADLGHFLLITIFVDGWRPKFSENSNQSSDTVAEIRRIYPLKRKLDGKSIANFVHKIIIVHLPDLSFLCYIY